MKPPLNKKNNKRNRKKNKIQEVIHEESLKDYQSWWWMTKVTSEKVRGPKHIKLAIQLWLTKGPIGENIFISGKEIQIWIGKGSMRNFEGLNCKKNLFLKSIQDLIGRN